jgi:hypothetical protein
MTTLKQDTSVRNQAIEKSWTEVFKVVRFLKLPPTLATRLFYMHAKTLHKLHKEYAGKADYVKVVEQATAHILETLYKVKLDKPILDMSVKRAVNNTVEKSINLRIFDGATNQKAYIGGAGKWQPLEGQIPLGVSYGRVRPFEIGAFDFEVEAPVTVKSEYDEIINQKLSKTDMSIADFWAGLPGTCTPPGIWIASALKHFNKDDRLTEIIFALATTLANTAVAVWKVKYAYKTQRPVNLAEASWKSYIATPPFPGYVSGHSTFSASAARVLESYGVKAIVIQGEIINKDGKLEFITKSFETTKEAALEAGISRLFGQIHIKRDDTNGQALGVSIADTVIKKLGGLK